jgi:GTP 3',8-cyclase
MPQLRDGFGRTISYLRVSVTDRCDLRCRYCMAEDMTFLPPARLMSFDAINAIIARFIARGVRKIRLTGGEPLARRGVPELAFRIGRHIATGALDELTLTTNGTRLAEHAPALAAAGIRRINVSLDTLDPERFRLITRWGGLDRTMSGISAAKAAGLKIKINMLALRGLNETDFLPMLEWCGTEGFDLTLIETMPLGRVDEDRVDRYLPLAGVREDLERRFTLKPALHTTGGPARYFDVAETGQRLGLITPMSANFCDGCNRIRLTAEGRLYTCLGHENHVDLKQAFAEGGAQGIDAALDAALIAKPLRHEFLIGADGHDRGPARHMNATGG